VLPGPAKLRKLLEVSLRLIGLALALALASSIGEKTAVGFKAREGDLEMGFRGDASAVVSGSEEELSCPAATAVSFSALPVTSACREKKAEEEVCLTVGLFLN